MHTDACYLWSSVWNLLHAIYVYLGFYAAWNGSFLPTFRDDLSDDNVSVVMMIIRRLQWAPLDETSYLGVITSVQYLLHIRTVHLDIIKVLFIHQLMYQ